MNHEVYRAVFESSFDAILLFDERSIFYSNPSALRMFGCSSRDEFIGKNAVDLSPPTQPGGEDSISLAKERIATAFKLGGNLFEWTHRRLDGSTFPAEVLLTPLVVEGKRVCQATVRDITERKRVDEAMRNSESMLREAQHLAGVGNWSWDTVTDTHMWSEEIYLIYGRDPRLPPASFQEVQNYFTPDSWEKLSAVVEEGLAQGRAYECDAEVVRPDGVHRWITARGKATLDADGKVVRLHGTVQDITERKRLESELLVLNTGLENKVAERTADLERARRDANEANRAKSVFLAAMSHEIRTPMNGVIGMVDVLMQTSLRGTQVEMVNIIHDSALALLDIIDDILDFSKIEAGKLLIESVPMGVTDVVERACGTMDRISSKKGTELTMFVDPAVPSEVMGDPGRLRQILINLINNAVKFSGGPRRKGKVSVRARMADGGPGRALVEFSVADNGVGMDDRTKMRLFTAFMQADSSTTRNYGGTGLGLAISLQLANLMGGEISVKSEIGKGSLFIVRIPFALPTNIPEADKAPSLVAGLSCLVVGDSDSLSANIYAYLTHAGAIVERVPDLAGVREWMAARPLGLSVVVVDAGGGKSPLDELRAIAGAHKNQKTKFVVIGRGQRREPRLEDEDWAAVDGNVLTRIALLKAVAIAAGRAIEAYQDGLPDSTRVTITPPSREEALRLGRLILVAEDNETNQKVIRQQLMLLGYTADVVEDGRKALLFLRSGDYGLLITDLHMPEMDGYELTKSVRASEAGKTHIPIIAYTANALKGEVDRCINAGMDDYISKPVQLAKLEAILKKWIPASLESAPVPQSSRIPVDVGVLKELVGDDEAVIRDFLRDFRATMDKTAAELREAFADGQTANVRALAHKLKSSARSVGALGLGELCAEIEQSCKAGDKDALAALLNGFEQELARVEQFLRERT